MQTYIRLDSVTVSHFQSDFPPFVIFAQVLHPWIQFLCCMFVARNVRQFYELGYFKCHSVATEADFCPPAGAGAPAHKLQRTPAGDEAPVIPLLHPEAPVKTRVPAIAGAPTYLLY